nr:nitrite reductase small subunit NirD [Cellulomonas marina]
MSAASAGTAAGWVPVCALSDLVPERGAAVLVDGQQVALFRLADDRVLGVQHRDPFSGANVLARGIVGSRGEAPVLTSPMLKQVWDLTTGACLDPVGREPQDLRTYGVRVEGDAVLLATA